VVETHQTDEDIRQKNDRESMMVVIEYATRYFSRMLLESEEGRDIGISYFKERGFRREIIDGSSLATPLVSAMPWLLMQEKMATKMSS
jgi:hypothetical protein